MYFYFYHVFMILSLIVLLFVIAVTWSRRNVYGAKAMIALNAATFVWALGFLLEANSVTLERQLFFNNIGYLGSMAVPVAWFVFALNYSNSTRVIHGWRTIPLCIIPSVVTILIWTNEWHHLMWYNEHLVISGPFLTTAKTYGSVFWAALVHNYLLIFIGGIILLRRLFVGTRLYTGQAVSLIFAVLLPWLWNIIFVFDLVPLPRKDLTPVMFSISGIVLALGLLRFHLFTIIPFAHKFVIKQLSDGIFAFNAHDCLVEANPMALKVLRLDESIVGKKLADLLPLSPAFEHMSLGKFGREEITLTLSGEKRVYELETAPMLDDHGQKVGWLAIFHDITERKLAEEQYKLVAEYSADVIYKLKIKEEQYIYVSPSVKRLLGYTEKEALTLKPETVLTKESYERQRFELLKDLESGTPDSTLQLEGIHKDGHIVPIEVHASLVFNERGEPVEIVGVARDITERKKMEEQLNMQDRLASIGQLSSGIAHEINNPLTGVITFSALLLQKELPDDIKQDLKIINEEAQRTARIVKNLLTFARKQPQEKHLTNINDSIQKVLEMRAYEEKVNNILVNVCLDPDLPQILGNSSQLQQVFFNIVINAEFFMFEAHGKGILTVTTEKSGDSVRASFADDGPGISKENMRQLFNPFFSTKEVGRGTGLGLSICHGIVTEHGGRIWAESESGKGTTFILELPIYNGSVQEEDIN